MSSFFRKSIGLSQAAFILLFSFVIGIVLSGLSLGYNLMEEQNRVRTLTQEILTTAQGGATSAAWTLDFEIAKEIVNSVMALTVVQQVILIDENQRILAESHKQGRQLGLLSRWIAEQAFVEIAHGERILSVPVKGEQRIVGSLSIKLDADRLAHDFLMLALSTILAVMAEALLIGLALLWLTSWLITSPLKRIAATISEIDPVNPEQAKLPELPPHQDNELGQLIQHTNNMLERLSSTQDQLRHLATRDPLTNRPNRTLITDRLTRAITAAQRNRTMVAVLFMDLDRFKTINDSLGHNIGDILLKEVSQRMAGVLRSNDSIGRLGGDEFLVVLENIYELNEIIRTVQRLSDTLSKSFRLEGHEVRTSASIGIAVYPNDGEDTNTLMRCADLAMYEAKGTDYRWHFFAKEMSDRMETRLSIEAALNQAIARDEFYLVFQPKVASKTGELMGCEALLRWREAPGSLSTVDMIKIAEETGLIVEIGEWVLEQSCQQIKCWQNLYGDLPVAVNVSARQLQSPNFVYRFLTIIKTHQVPAKLIELEVTETVLLDAIDESFSALKALRQAGVSIAIDDFGTGYSSLSYLTQLPVDVLKIDKSFVSGNMPSTAVLEMIVAMAKTLHLKTVAEGVEDIKQMQWLIEKGCDYLQGYYISEPVFVEEFEAQFLQSMGSKKSIKSLENKA